ncbi:MAG: hypothetical protein AMXMBFR13_25230 [Phycisphaerae bacterium]
MRHRAGRKPPCAAFTLIEVLAVVAVIALLLAILLPSLSRARTQAGRTVCRSNLRTLGQFAALFHHDNAGRLPRSSHSVYHGFPPFSEVARWKWDYAFYRYATGHPLNRDAMGGPGWLDLVNQNYHCPLDERVATSANPGLVSYGYSNWFELDRTGDLQMLSTFLNESRTWRSVDRVRRPAATILFGERSSGGGSGGGSDHMMAHFWAMGLVPETDVEVDRNRHRPRSGYVFVDGHAEDLEFSATFNSQREIDDWYPATAQ